MKPKRRIQPDASFFAAKANLLQAGLGDLWKQLLDTSSEKATLMTLRHTLWLAIEARLVGHPVAEDLMSAATRFSDACERQDDLWLFDGKAKEFGRTQRFRLALLTEWLVREERPISRLSKLCEQRRMSTEPSFGTPWLDVREHGPADSVAEYILADRGRDGIAFWEEHRRTVSGKRLNWSERAAEALAEGARSIGAHPGGEEPPRLRRLYLDMTDWGTTWEFPRAAWDARFVFGAARAVCLGRPTSASAVITGMRDRA